MKLITLVIFILFKAKLLEVKAKFRLFQKPANFDQRLKECERVLEEVKEELGVMSIHSVEQEVVQSQLEQCMVGIICFVHLHKFSIICLFFCIYGHYVKSRGQLLYNN